MPHLKIIYVFWVGLNGQLRTFLGSSGNSKLETTPSMRLGGWLSRYGKPSENQDQPLRFRGKLCIVGIIINEIDWTSVEQLQNSSTVSIAGFIKEIFPILLIMQSSVLPLLHSPELRQHAPLLPSAGFSLLLDGQPDVGDVSGLPSSQASRARLHAQVRTWLHLLISHDCLSRRLHSSSI